MKLFVRDKYYRKMGYFVPAIPSVYAVTQIPFWKLVTVENVEKIINSPKHTNAKSQ